MNSSTDAESCQAAIRRMDLEKDIEDRLVRQGHELY